MVVGVRGRPIFVAVTKIRRNILLKKILHWTMANSIPQHELPHFC